MCIGESEQGSDNTFNQPWESIYLPIMKDNCGLTQVGGSNTLFASLLRKFVSYRSLIGIAFRALYRTLRAPGEIHQTPHMLPPFGTDTISPEVR